MSFASKRGLDDNGLTDDGESSEQKRTKTEEQISTAMVPYFFPFGEEPKAKTLLEKLVRDYVHGLSDKEYKLLTKIIRDVLNSILTSSKTSTRMGGQQTLIVTNSGGLGIDGEGAGGSTSSLPTLPLTGENTTKTVSDKFTSYLSRERIAPNFGQSDPNFQFEVIRFFLSRFSTLSKEDADTMMTDMNGDSIAICLISPALPGFDSFQTQTGRSVSSLAHAVSVLDALFREKLSSHEIPAKRLPSNLLVIDIMGHCAQRGGTAAMMRIEKDDGGEEYTISELNVAEEAIDVDDSTSEDEEKYLGAIISFVDKVMIVAEQTYDDEAKGKDDGDDIVTLSTTSTSSSSALGGGGGDGPSSFGGGRGGSPSSFGGGRGGSPSTFGGGRGGSGTDKDHSLRVDQNESLEASTCFMIEQLRVERPGLHAFLCSMRFAKSKANLSTTVALNAVGKLCHPCVTKSTHGQFDLLVFIVLRMIGYSAGSISKGLGLSSTTSSNTLTSSAASEADKRLQEVLASTRNSVRLEVGRNWKEAYPPCPLPSSPFYSVRLVIEKELSKYLKPNYDDGKGPSSKLPTRFETSSGVEKIVRPVWEQLQSANPAWQREPWSLKLAAEAFAVWGKSTSAVFRLRSRGSSVCVLTESNPLKDYKRLMTDALRQILSYRQDSSDNSKKYATPDELDVIISGILRKYPLKEGVHLTMNHIREAYQYWGPSGSGTSTARQKAGNASATMVLIQVEVRRLLFVERSGLKFTDPLSNDEESQLRAATLKALNEHNKSEVRHELPEELSDFVVDWANGFDGRQFLAHKLKRK
jgi:hypothetical protein